MNNAILVNKTYIAHKDEIDKMVDFTIKEIKTSKDTNLKQLQDYQKVDPTKFKHFIRDYTILHFDEIKKKAVTPCE